MKTFRKSVRRFIPTIIFSVIFTLLFPYSLMAQSKEQTVSEYKIPEHSMSYLAQAQTVGQPAGNTTQAAATLSNSDRQELEPEFAVQTQSPAKIQIVSEPTPIELKQHHKIKVTRVSPQKNAHKQPTELLVKTTNQVPDTTEKPFLAASSRSQSENPLFSEALSKMQQNSAQRQAEAARLGIVLPSQGGDMASVSPSLSKMQQTIKNIMAR